MSAGVCWGIHVITCITDLTMVTDIISRVGEKIDPLGYRSNRHKFSSLKTGIRLINFNKKPFSSPQERLSVSVVT